MKSNFNLKKFLCCILLSLVMAFSNISALFSVFYDFNQCSQIYAYDYGSYFSYIFVSCIDLNEWVYLTGDIRYIYHFDPVDGHEVFDGIEIYDWSLHQNYESYKWGYRWYLNDYTWALNDDGTKLNINIRGKLKKIGTFWDDIEDISRDCTINL